MHIDSHIPITQQVFTPVRPDPVPPGLDTQRPVPTPNGAEAGARHPLQDNDRESTQRNRETAEKSTDPARQKAQRDGQQALSQTQQREVEQLKVRDREVRAHELAHKAAAGQHARGGPSYEYQQGPDGKRYAVGGEVSIDTSRTGDPQKDLEKARTIRQAALAPAQPSVQDRSVAAAASAMEAAAQKELQAERAEQLQEQQAARNERSEEPRGQLSEAYAPRRATDAQPAVPVGGFLDVFT